MPLQRKKEYVHTKDISLSCERFYLVQKVYLRGLWMNNKKMLLQSFSLCRWFGFTSNAPHAVLEHHPPRNEPHSANPAAATHLLVPWCSPHPLLLPTLSSNGVHGEPQPRPSKNDPEQWTVCRGRPTVSSQGVRLRRSPFVESLRAHGQLRPLCGMLPIRHQLFLQSSQVMLSALPSLQSLGIGTGKWAVFSCDLSERGIYCMLPTGLV